MIPRCLNNEFDGLRTALHYFLPEQDAVVIQIGKIWDCNTIGEESFQLVFKGLKRVGKLIEPFKDESGLTFEETVKKVTALVDSKAVLIFDHLGQKKFQGLPSQPLEIEKWILP